MSESESTIDVDAKRDELISKAQEKKQELDEKQNEALAAIAEGGELEDYETVTLGELEIEVKAWLPGSVEETVTKANRLGQQEDMGKIRESMETMLSALDEMTRADEYDMAFWRKYYAEWGPEGLILAIETILDPAMEGVEERSEGVESFRTR